MSGVYCGIPIRTKSQIDIDFVAMRFGTQIATDVNATGLGWIRYAYDHFTGTLYVVDSGNIAANTNTSETK